MDSEKTQVLDYAVPSTRATYSERKIQLHPMLGVHLLTFASAASLSTIAYSRNLTNSIAICAAFGCFLLAALGFVTGLVRLVSCDREKFGPQALAVLLYLAIAVGLFLIPYLHLSIGSQEYGPD